MGYLTIKTYPQLIYGNLVDVIDFIQKDESGEKWYYVRIAGRYFGFVHSGYISDSDRSLRDMITLQKKSL